MQTQPFKRLLLTQHTVGGFFPITSRMSIGIADVGLRWKAYHKYVGLKLVLYWPSCLSKLCHPGLDAWTADINQFLFGDELPCVCAGCCNVGRIKAQMIRPGNQSQFIWSPFFVISHSRCLMKQDLSLFFVRWLDWIVDTLTGFWIDVFFKVALLIHHKLYLT